ncbi:MAG: glucose-6-phosphate isomerase [Clostridia bacterium]|nr:glucose-6-phosphate isomerase [Clostridia bacterium]
MELIYENSMITDSEISKYAKKVQEAHEKLTNKTGEGSDFLGWVNLEYDKEEIERLKQAAAKIRRDSDYLVVVGIGGSYLGARAVIEALSHTFRQKNVLFAGNNMSPDYINDLVEFIKDRDFSINVISKSGTTTEPAIAFSILKELLTQKYGKDGARERIYITTDKEKGILKREAMDEGYETFIVPDNIGGRYSVLTPVGLLPIAVAGINIDTLMLGASQAMQKYENLLDNEAYTYAILRNALLKKGRNIEIMVNYEPKLHYFTEWWKQLFGESEGKDGKGIFPAGVDNTTDLHSMGQYIQEGQRMMFETVIDIANPYRDYKIPVQSDKDLDFLSAKSLNDVNHMAMEGTIKAHVDGNVPNIRIKIDRLDEFNIGWLIYFFERACGISGYMLGVNPFNQPGVEAYKKEMFKLLGKE